MSNHPKLLSAFPRIFEEAFSYHRRHISVTLRYINPKPDVLYPIPIGSER
eukprot:UN07954